MELAWAPDYDVQSCSIGAAVGIIGEKWTFLVLREAFNGVRRFGDMQRRTQAPRQILSDRLARLVREGLLRRVPYQDEGQRARHEYRLTGKGRDLYPIIIALMHWGDRYAAEPAGPPVTLTHRDCGQPVRLRLTCDDGHALASPREVTPVPGPAARKIA
jgi:DNA-binding HxlR family transcriptional regulator